MGYCTAQDDEWLSRANGALHASLGNDLGAVLLSSASAESPPYRDVLHRRLMSSILE